MDSKLDDATKEIQNLIQDHPPTVNQIQIITGDAFNPPGDENEKTAEHEENKRFLVNETFDPIPSADNHEIKIWRRKINKSLVSFRIMQFVWYGAGSLPSTFLGIFLKQRGLTIFELSSAYSMIFVFQFIACSITGAITDKIGDAKPVLMFLMLSSSCVLVSMSLLPNINNVSCTALKENLTDFNNSEINNNFSSCYFNCILNNTNHVYSAEIGSESSMHENASLIKIFDFVIDNDTNICNFSVVSFTNISLNLSEDDCCIACLNSTRVECVTLRNGYLVIVYTVLILAFYTVWSTTYRFLNFTSLSVALKSDSYFGKELAIGKSAELLIIIMVGFVLNIDKSSGSQINFDPVIRIAAGMIFFDFLVLSMIKVPILPPGVNLLKNALSLVRDIDILAFILVVFIAGNGFCFMFTFRLVILQALNAPSTLVALHSVAVVLYGFPLMLTSEWWLKKFGAKTIFVLGLLFYAVNNAAFSFVYNPWWSLLIDITLAFTYYLFWISAVVHCRNVAPMGFAATLNALTGSVHFGIGRSSGVFFGGMLMNYLGNRKAFRIIAAIFFVAAILYAVFLYFRHKSPPANTTMNDDDILEREKSKDGDIESV